MPKVLTKKSLLIVCTATYSKAKARRTETNTPARIDPATAATVEDLAIIVFFVNISKYNFLAVKKNPCRLLFWISFFVDFVDYNWVFGL